jgi:hypothetical protein
MTICSDHYGAVSVIPANEELMIEQHTAPVPWTLRNIPPLRVFAFMKGTSLWIRA